jgi:HK97 gp10 family phage protein
MARKAGKGQVLTIKGLKEVDRALKKLPGVIAKKVLRQALRKAMKPVRDEVKQDAPVDKGLLKSAVKVKAGKRSRNSVSVVVRIGEGDFKGETYYGALQEFGFERDGILYPGKHFMENAFNATGPEAAQTAMKEIVKGAEAAAAQLNRSR